MVAVVTAVLCGEWTLVKADRLERSRTNILLAWEAPSISGTRARTRPVRHGQKTSNRGGQAGIAFSNLCDGQQSIQPSFSMSAADIHAARMAARAGDQPLPSPRSRLDSFRAERGAAPLAALSR